MAGRSLRALLVALFVFGLFNPPASADGPDASDPPRTSGPLIGVAFPCEDNGPAGRDELNAQACSWTYDLLPAETNLGEDFSAVWVQMEVDPGPGWCADLLTVRMKVPNGMRIASVAPHESGPVRPTAPRVTELVVDAEGAAPVPGAIAQDVAPPSGRVSVAHTARNLTYSWTGHERHKVVVAVGVEIAHTVPLGRFATDWEVGLGAGASTCKAVTILVTHRGHGG